MDYDYNKEYKMVAMKKMLYVFIGLQIFLVCVLTFVLVLACNDPWSGWGTALIIIFAVLEIVAIAFACMVSLSVVINKDYIEIRGVRGVYAKFSFDAIERIDEGVYHTGAYWCRGINIVLKEKIQKCKKNLLFQGKGIFIELNDKRRDILKHFIGDDITWNILG